MTCFLSRFGRILCLVLCLWHGAPAMARAEAVSVFAAASLKDALDRLAPGFEEATGHRLVLSFAGTSVLARQILQGAPADVFIAANAQWMDALQDAGRIDPASRFDLAGNRLVLIATTGQGAAPVSLEAGIPDPGRVAMALVDAVPAGMYGKAALQSLGHWGAVAPRVVQTDNVRAALLLVARGSVPFGVVYASDALVEPRVTVLATFPAESHPPIRYPVALVSGRGGAGARAFVTYLQSPAAQSELERAGLLPAPE